MKGNEQGMDEWVQIERNRVDRKEEEKDGPHVLCTLG